LGLLGVSNWLTIEQLSQNDFTDLAARAESPFLFDQRTRIYELSSALHFDVPFKMPD
jgi:hypothetical protein